MFTVLGGAFLTFIVAKRRSWGDKLFFRVTTPLAKFIVMTVSENNGRHTHHGDRRHQTKAERFQILQTGCAWQMVTVWDNAFLTSRCTGARDTGTIWFLVNLQRAP